MNAVALFWMMSLLLAAGAMLLLRRAQLQAASERVLSRLHDETLLRAERRQGHGLRRLLLQAGVNLPVSALCLLALLFALLVVAIAAMAGAFAALCALLILLGAMHFLLRWRYRQRVTTMVGQLPAFLDHVIRSLKSGRSLGDALQLAITRCHDPLRGALGGCQRSLELGLPLGEVMSDFAELYDRQEFHMLAVSVKVNQRYGGNASELMDSLILLIRDRERAAGQLRALTGETRIGAWVLGLMPILIGGYVFMSNPDLFLNLWEDPTGRLMLFGSLGLQAIGTWLLWRMLRSV